jgi:stage II sporulation protein AB (anti-sigma F factor)
MIRVECHSNDGRRVVIIVSDEGVGIENIEKAKEPLFTTGKSDERSGMGFTVMESFMDKIEIESERGKGTRVTMFKNLDLAYEL